jgi:hypothetical protein
MQILLHLHVTFFLFLHRLHDEIQETAIYVSLQRHICAVCFLFSLCLYLLLSRHLLRGSNETQVIWSPGLAWCRRPKELDAGTLTNIPLGVLVICMFFPLQYITCHISVAILRYGTSFVF